VGGSAQIKSMKRVAGTLKLDQAQFRELEAFSKFGSDLDATTLAVLDKGSKNVEILKQPLHSPTSVEKQIAIIFCGTHGLLSDIPVEKIKEFEDEFLGLLELKHKNILNTLKEGKLNEETEKHLTDIAKEIIERLK
jgi:F-type H+-transporting ATPase subunit alpha